MQSRNILSFLLQVYNEFETNQHKNLLEVILLKHNDGVSNVSFNYIFQCLLRLTSVTRADMISRFGCPPSCPAVSPCFVRLSKASDRREWTDGLVQTQSNGRSSVGQVTMSNMVN